MTKLSKGEKFVIENNANYINKSFSDFLIACEEDRLDLGYNFTEVRIPNIVEWFDEDPDCSPFNDLDHSAIDACLSNGTQVKPAKEEVINVNLTDFNRHKAIIFAYDDNIKKICLPNLKSLDKYFVLFHSCDNLEYVDISNCDKYAFNVSSNNNKLKRHLTVKVKNEEVADKIKKRVWYRQNSELIDFEYGGK